MSQPNVIVYSSANVSQVPAMDEDNTFTGNNTFTGATTISTLYLPYVAKTEDYTATATNYTIAVTCSTVNITITLPAVSGTTGRIYNIKKMDSTLLPTNDRNSYLPPGRRYYWFSLLGG